MQSENTGFMNEMVSTFEYCLRNPFLKIICAGVSCIALMTTMAQADNRDFFETWRKIEGFDVGYACNWNATTPGPESLFEVKKLKAAEFVATSKSAEFRLIRPTSANRTENSYDQSLFDVRLDKGNGAAIALRILYPFSADGYCGFLVKYPDASKINLLRGVGPSFGPPPSRNALRWVNREISACYRQLKRAFDPSILVNCVMDIDPNPKNPHPTEGLRSSVMPEGVVPASVARIYLKNQGTVFSITTYGDKIEVEKVENLK